MKWQENAAPVMEQSIAAAISWVQKLTFEQALSQASRLDTLLEAGKDKTVSVYPGLAPGHEGGFKLISSHSISSYCLSADLGPFPVASHRDRIIGRDPVSLNPIHL